MLPTILVEADVLPSQINVALGTEMGIWEHFVRTRDFTRTLSGCFVYQEFIHLIFSEYLNVFHESSALIISNGNS